MTNKMSWVLPPCLLISPHPGVYIMVNTMGLLNKLSFKASALVILATHNHMGGTVALLI